MSLQRRILQRLGRAKITGAHGVKAGLNLYLTGVTK